MIIGYFENAVTYGRSVPVMSTNGVMYNTLYEYTIFNKHVPTQAKYWAEWLYNTETRQWLKDTKDRPSKEEMLLCVLKAKSFENQ